jgi:broad-specificity NMP kinase
MVIVINGPLGIGKTETAWRVAQLLAPAAVIDIDWVSAVEPFDYRNPRDVDYAQQSAVVLAQHHSRHGFENIVVNWVFENQSQLDGFSRLFESVRAYLLTCSLEELERRIRQRGGPDLDRDLARGRELHAILGQAKNIGVPIDTEGRSVHEVAAAIVDDIRA